MARRDSETLRLLKQIPGVTLGRRTKHGTQILYQGRPVGSCSSSPSDWRGERNLLAELRRRGVPITSTGTPLLPDPEPEPQQQETSMTSMTIITDEASAPEADPDDYRHRPRPGRSNVYWSFDERAQAADVIRAALADKVRTGDEILDALTDAGMRVPQERTVYRFLRALDDVTEERVGRYFRGWRYQLTTSAETEPEHEQEQGVGVTVSAAGALPEAAATALIATLAEPPQRALVSDRVQVRFVSPTTVSMTMPISVYAELASLIDDMIDV